jgi:hypothetical protein
MMCPSGRSIVQRDTCASKRAIVLRGPRRQSQGWDIRAGCGVRQQCLERSKAEAIMAHVPSSRRSTATPPARRSATGSTTASTTKRALATAAFIPSGEAIALFKAVELGAKGAKALSEWLANEGPLVVQVLESYPSGKQYRVHFRATNQTMHGMYLLGAELEWPQAIKPLALQKPPERRIGWGDELPPMVPMPMPAHVPTARQIEFCIAFPLPSRADMDTGLWDKRIGRMRLMFQVLDSEKTTPKVTTFAIVLA